MQDEKMIQHFTSAILGILKLVSETAGPDAATELLRRINRQFAAPTDTNGADAVAAPAEPAVSRLQSYVNNGGYELTDHDVMIAVSGTAKRAKAFGVLPPEGEDRLEAQLCFLLHDDSEICGTVREFSRHSYNPRPAYSHNPAQAMGNPEQNIILFYGPEQRMGPHDCKRLIDNLNAAGVTTLAQACLQLNPFAQG